MSYKDDKDIKDMENKDMEKGDTYDMNTQHNECPLNCLNKEEIVNIGKPNRPSGWITVTTIIFIIGIIFTCGGLAKQLTVQEDSIKSTKDQISKLESRVNDMATAITTSLATQKIMAEDIRDIKNLLFNKIKEIDGKVIRESLKQ